MDFFQNEVSDLLLGIIEFLIRVINPIDEFVDGKTSYFVDIEAVDSDRQSGFIETVAEY